MNETHKMELSRRIRLLEAARKVRPLTDAEVVALSALYQERDLADSPFYQGGSSFGENED